MHGDQMRTKYARHMLSTDIHSQLNMLALISQQCNNARLINNNNSSHSVSSSESISSSSSSITDLQDPKKDGINNRFSTDISNETPKKTINRSGNTLDNVNRVNTNKTSLPPHSYLITQSDTGKSTTSILHQDSSIVDQKSFPSILQQHQQQYTYTPSTTNTSSTIMSATSSRSNSGERVVKVVTTAGPQNVDKEFLQQLLSRKDVIPQRKRRDFIPNEMKDDHYWERRRKNNLAAKRSREKRRLNDIVLETKVVELTNENDVLRAKLNLMLTKINMKENEMELLFEEEQRLGNICLKPATSATAIMSQMCDNTDDNQSLIENSIATTKTNTNSNKKTTRSLFNSSSSETAYSHEDDYSNDSQQFVGEADNQRGGEEEEEEKFSHHEQQQSSMSAHCQQLQNDFLARIMNPYTAQSSSATTTTSATANQVLALAARTQYPLLYNQLIGMNMMNNMSAPSTGNTAMDLSTNEQKQQPTKTTNLLCPAEKHLPKVANRKPLQLPIQTAYITNHNTQTNELKTGNLLTTKSPSPLTPSPSPPHESLLQVLANQLKQASVFAQSTPTLQPRLLTIAPKEEHQNSNYYEEVSNDDMDNSEAVNGGGKTKNALKRSYSHVDDANNQQSSKLDERQVTSPTTDNVNKSSWDDAVTLLSLTGNYPQEKPPTPTQQPSNNLLQSVINGLLTNRKISHEQSPQREDVSFNNQDTITSFNQLRTLINFISNNENGKQSVGVFNQVFPQNMNSNKSTTMNNISESMNVIPSSTISVSHERQLNERTTGDAMPLKLRLKMLNVKS
ncbi:unnamed protein product [Didymodactylos carnosus]|uniref:BZIP domain-containing protein n=1 Tax=Didymodactylos carnosus TaxID=1234261 RepID=A0A814LH49_9BILA|nr:unnamed protein product [Didymodactylos carnosus]CAF1065106.1 unnamed protein product [Didymodactylos carnosus]CAF3705198.1 unnamed protein product [Didymodactylos carnosus]CAF3832907.1 unnamed protein product [Didymodactylos carnosus]